MPQYELGHLGRVKKIGDELQKLPGLKIAGNIFAARVFLIAFAAVKQSLTNCSKVLPLTLKLSLN